MSSDNLISEQTDSQGKKNPLIVIVGPTAVGKTDFSIQLAEKEDGEVVSADSRLFYRGMNIGTAKPTLIECKGIFHHLVDVADPDQTWSLAIFQEKAREAITGIHERGKTALLVGGTGQYIHAVTRGWSPPATPPNDSFRKMKQKFVDDYGYAQIHNELARLDPEAASNIDPRNYRRTIRALEVIHFTGRKFSDQRTTTESHYRLLTIGLNLGRELLYKRVDDRIESMFSSGLIDEVKSLLDKGYSPDLPSMSSIGYRECVDVIQGKLTVEEAKAYMRRRTRIFIRRQANWFKLTDPTIHWFDAKKIDLSEISLLVNNFLRSD